MPPEDRIVPRFVAEPPQSDRPSGPWAQRLREEFLAACLRIDAIDDPIGDPGELRWHPDRSWHGRTFVPVTAATSEGLEVYGYVSYVDGDRPTELHARADVTAETADANPDWAIDLCDEVIGSWRGEDGAAAAMTLVWGTPLVDGAAVATAELGGVAVDQCGVADGRFTLLAPDDYRGQTIEIAVFGRSGAELARESLYADDED